MIFSLEALNAKHGDCLILHFGTRKDPRYILIDGGPAGVFRSTLHPRLLQLASREPDLALQFELVLISHIDDDHIRGIIDLADDLIEQKESRIPLDRFIIGIWHNSFDDIVGDSGRAAGPMAPACNR